MKTISHYFTVTNESDILPSFKSALGKVARKHSPHLLQGQFFTDLATAFTEGVANAIRHAKELRRRVAVDYEIKLQSPYIHIRIFDHGKGFNIGAVPPPRFEDLKESGRGIFMMRQLMDCVTYKRGRKKNFLHLKRYLMGHDERSKDLDLVYEMSRTVLENTNAEALYQTILDKAVRVFRAEKASILAYDPRIKKLKVIASRGLDDKVKKETRIRPGQGISGFVFQHAKACLIEDIATNPAGWTASKKYKSRSFISAPIISKVGDQQQSLGVINMTDRVGGRPFTKRDLTLLTTIANQASAYLHISQLYAQTKQAELLQKEFEIARGIQRKYLPVASPRMPGFDIAGWCETAQFVGGDYYDFFPDGDGHYLAIADVSGHNVAAAMTMVNLRSQLKALLLKEKSPGKIVEFLNRNLFDDLASSDQFVTMLLVRVLPQYKKMEITNAGHFSPLAWRQGQWEEIFPYKESGAVLGAVEGEKYATKSYAISPGDSIVLYTDGIPEMINAAGQQLGPERWRSLLSAVASAGAKPALDYIKRELKKWRGSENLRDDVTAVILKVTR